ncbi:CRISPR-associated RAMP protein Csx10 [soil metagenome]
MIAVTYTLELIEPLLATGLVEGDPNTKRSLNFIPGSMMRGALIAAYLRKSGRSTLDNGDPENRRRFFTTATRYLNAYPALKLGDKLQRSLPTPRSWQQEKGVELTNESQIIDFAVSQDERHKEPDECKQIDKPFYVSNDGAIYLLKPERHLRLHTARARRHGRAILGDGAVFQYDALAPGQTFQGVIITSNQPDADEFANLLNAGELWVGGSREAGYGRARVMAQVGEWRGETPESEQTSAYNAWGSDEAYDEDDQDEDRDEPIPIARRGEDNDTEPSPQDESTILYLTCTSHWILYDANGQPCADPPLTLLAKKLGIASHQLELVPNFTHRTLTRVGGFNRTAGMPLPQAYAIEAGSVFVYKMMGKLDETKLDELVEAGIGEQRLDGFGRLAVNLHQSRVLEYRELAKTMPEETVSPALPAGQSRLLAQQMGERILRNRIDQSVAAYVKDHSLESRLVISNSVLARVRTATRTGQAHMQQALAIQPELDLETLAQRGFQPLRELLGDLKKPARDQLNAARVKNSNNMRLERWLYVRLDEYQKIWSEISAPTILQLGELQITPPPGWQVEYTLQILDDVLRMARKEAAKPNQQEVV